MKGRNLKKLVNTIPDDAEVLFTVADSGGYCVEDSEEAGLFEVAGDGLFKAAEGRGKISVFLLGGSHYEGATDFIGGPSDLAIESHP